MRSSPTIFKGVRSFGYNHTNNHSCENHYTATLAREIGKRLAKHTKQPTNRTSDHNNPPTVPLEYPTTHYTVLLMPA
jgi:hypothetical protein